jgi:8-oxo-dGTP pyrophosphatase MutT (NUDIX family)/phosphohistidine phosphatase SixA
MADSGAADHIRAAGAVLWRPAGPGVQVAVVHRPKYDDWSFAKGKLFPGEHVLLAAVREVEEETGLRVTLGRRLAPVRYLIDGLRKRVDYWTARADAASAEFVANSEVDTLEWVPPEQAGRRLSYPHDVRLLADFAAGPRQTVPLILVRHASAGAKSAWHSGDQARPLDGRGTQQAELLARLLGCFGAGRVLSSPAERCLATVRPFAACAGIEVEVEPALAVPAENVKKKVRLQAREALAQAAAGAAADDRPVVICAHRENIPLILASVCNRLGAAVPAGPALRKGGFWVLHRAAGQLAGAECHHPEDDQ